MFAAVEVDSVTELEGQVQVEAKTPLNESMRCGDVARKSIIGAYSDQKHLFGQVELHFRICHPDQTICSRVKSQHITREFIARIVIRSI